MAFDSNSFLPGSAMDQVTELRISRAEIRRRKRRPRLTDNGKLNILAADHPGRRVTGVGGDPLAMADRRDFLARIVRVLQSPSVDGIMATMDVLDDLCLLDHAVVDAGGASFLDDRLLIASLNRGGLSGTVWELDDPMTGPEPEQLASLGIDGGKILLRVAHDDAASLGTLLATVHTMRRMNACRLPTFLEPLPVRKGKLGWEVIKEAGAMARLVGVATALGDSSRLVWLKLPYCENYAVVAQSTTLPILLLGGAAVGDASPLLSQIAAGLAAGANVRGALVGRNVLYPGDGDPLGTAVAVGGLIHKGWTLEQAIDAMNTSQPLEALI